MKIAILLITSKNIDNKLILRYNYYVNLIISVQGGNNMKFNAPNSYTDEPGILTLEDGDPSIDEIKRVFGEKGLKVAQKGSSLEVTVSKKGFFEKIFIGIISQATYIYMQSESAINELENS